MEQEIKRLAELIHNTNPLSADYQPLLDKLERCYSIQFCYINRPALEPVIPEAKPEEVPEEPKPTTKRKSAKKAGTPTEPAPMPDPVAESVPTPVVEEENPASESKVEEPKEEAPTLDKATVRAMLSDASKAGIQIQPIIKKFVPDGKPIKFSEVSASDYPALVKELNNAR